MAFALALALAYPFKLGLFGPDEAHQVAKVFLRGGEGGGASVHNSLASLRAPAGGHAVHLDAK